MSGKGLQRVGTAFPNMSCQPVIERIGRLHSYRRPMKNSYVLEDPVDVSRVRITGRGEGSFLNLTVPTVRVRTTKVI